MSDDIRDKMPAQINRDEHIKRGNLAAKRAALYLYDSNTDDLLPVSSDNPIPTSGGGGGGGDASAANQVTGNASLSSIDTKTPALGQALAAASTPVVLTAAQLSTLTPPAAITGFLTESDFDTKTGSLTETAPATDTASSGLNGRLQRIAQRLTSIIALLPGSLGQKARAASLAVTLSTEDITALTPTTGLTDAQLRATPVPVDLGANNDVSLTDGTNTANILKSDGTAAGQNSQLVAGTYLEVSYSTASVQAVATTDVKNYRWVSVHSVTMGGSATITFQGSNDNTNWVSVALNLTSSTGGGNISTSTSSAAQIWHGPINFRYFRLNVTGIVSGTTAGVIEFSTLPGAYASTAVYAAQNGTWNIGTVTTLTGITNALPAGTNAIGKLAANSGVDIGDVDVTSSVSSTLDHGSNLDIDTSAEQITTTSFAAKFGVTVKAAVDNTDTVYIGNSDVTAGTTAATDGFPLEPGESITLPVNNSNLLYAIGAAANQKVFWSAV